MSNVPLAASINVFQGQKGKLKYYDLQNITKSELIKHKTCFHVSKNAS